MDIGIPTEIKPDERRVALTPAGARELARRGHRVVVQRGAGAGAGFSDAAYLAAGAECAGLDEVFGEAELILKVKEPQAEEIERLSEQHTLFAYLHLAADPEPALALAASGARGIAYETVEDAHGRLPLLAPMSEVAGKLATQAGAAALTGPGGGAPRLVRRAQLAGMRPGSVLVDISIDQGGCFETSRPTTHSAPTYAVDGVVHYCVTNMPGAVAATSTRALTNATLGYALRLADLGPEAALDGDPGFARGLNVADGRIVQDVVAAALAPA